MTHSTAIHGYRYLNETKVRMLAQRYGLDPNSTIVRGNADQADNFHGKKCELFDGNLKRFWGCDEFGRYNAERLLDGYLDEETRVMRCDALADADFAARAYGE
jgi:hypothetical protein